jgi:bifunctional non-homologous end joining protein LigD
MNWIAPMEPISLAEVKEDSEYIHEVKWDGIRGLVYLQDKELKIYTKKGNERTDFYPELSFLANEFKNKNIILDGEIIVLDQMGLPSFYNSLIRETVRNKKNLKYYQKNYPIKYIVFDVLQYKDKLLTKSPLYDRKQLLEQLINPIITQNATILLSEVCHDGKDLFQKVKQKNMEGIVSKRTNSFYIAGKKHDAWFKTKFTKKMLCVIGGIQWKGEKPNSLVLGVKTAENEKLTYVGKASLGLKESDLKLLKDYRNELSQEECPFIESNISGIGTTGTELMWINPLITCWINFLELSSDGHFRHPKIIGFTDLPTVEANGKVLTD